MPIKEKEDLQPTFDTSNGFLTLLTLTKQRGNGLRTNSATSGLGSRGKKDAAYRIDFALKNGKNWAVIHDLRLEHKGRVAQIDHLLISRMFDLIVTESKNVLSFVAKL